MCHYKAFRRGARGKEGDGEGGRRKTKADTRTNSKFYVTWMGQVVIIKATPFVLCFQKQRLNTLELKKPKHFYYLSKPTRVKISYKNVYFKTSLIAFLRRERFLICFKYCLLSEGLAILFLMYIQVGL